MLMSKLLIIIISFLIAIIGYKNAECDKCKYEAILFGIIFYQLRNYDLLGLKLLGYFIIGEILISYFEGNK